MAASVFASGLRRDVMGFFPAIVVGFDDFELDKPDVLGPRSFHLRSSSFGGTRSW